MTQLSSRNGVHDDIHAIFSQIWNHVVPAYGVIDSISNVKIMSRSSPYVEAYSFEDVRNILDIDILGVERNNFEVIHFAFCLLVCAIDSSKDKLFRKETNESVSEIE